MKSNMRIVTVNGKTYRVWADYIIRGMCAEDENGKNKKIHGNGYLSNELSIRKAIAACFGLQTFKEQSSTLIMPAIPAHSPQIVKMIILYFLTLTPARLTASSLVPQKRQ